MRQPCSVWASSQRTGQRWDGPNIVLCRWNVSIVEKQRWGLCSLAFNACDCGRGNDSDGENNPISLEDSELLITRSVFFYPLCLWTGVAMMMMMTVKMTGCDGNDNDFDMNALAAKQFGSSVMRALCQAECCWWRLIVMRWNRRRVFASAVRGWDGRKRSWTR